MTRAEIRNNIKFRLEEDGVYRTDAEINDAIYESMKILCVITGCFSKYASIGIKDGIAIYSAPFDFFLPLRLSVSDDYPTAGQNSKRIFPETVANISTFSSDWFDDSGTPGYYFMLSGLGETGTCPEGRVGAAQFWLYPRPNAIKILRIEYVYFPQGLTDTEEPDVPIIYHKLFEDYGTYWSLLKEDNQAIFLKAVSIWNQFIKDALFLRTTMLQQHEGSDFSFFPFEWQKEKPEAVPA